MGYVYCFGTLILGNRYIMLRFNVKAACPITRGMEALSQECYSK